MMPEFLNSSYGLRLTVPQVIEEIAAFMHAEPARHYKITIGTDSQRLSDGRADFVSAVVVHRLGNGGRYFWRRFELGKFHTLRDRILKEVMISLELATGILAQLREHPIPSFDFEVHADIGENGPTKVMLQEVVAMIRAHNFQVRTKPESYAASNIADRHV